MNSGKLMLIDGNSILNRAFYGLQGSQMLATSYGLYTNAVFGFINILKKYIDEEKPDYICVAFDLKAPTFRHKEYEGYKAKRKGMPQELVVQVPVIKEVLDAMNVKRLEYEGFEADDIIGSVSYCAEKLGMDVVIVTGDKDSLQLASKTTRIKMPVTRGGKTETEEYDYDKMIEKYGVTPEQFIDVKGLMGDASDNIPGVAGIGEKTAIDLIKKFNSIEEIYDRIDNVDKPSVREKLSVNRDMAFMSKRLATIDRNMPELCSISELKKVEANKEKLFDLFTRLEFKSLIEKLGLGTVSTKKETRTKKVECIEDLKQVRSLKSILLLRKEFSIYCLIDKTGDFSNKLTGIGFSWDENESIYVDLNGCLSAEEFLSEFKEIFEDGSIKKYGHDLKQFITFLMNKDIRFNGLAFDTMIAAYIISPSNDTYMISELAEQYLGINIESIEELSGKGKSFIHYGEMERDKIASVAGINSEVIYLVQDILGKMLKENSQEKLYKDIELPLVEVLAEMEYWGFKVDTDGLKVFSVELEEKINNLTTQIYEHAGEIFNINSTKQLGVILFEKLGLPIIKKTKTGYSTDAEVLDELASMHEIVARLVEYRQLVKLKSTYVEGLLNVINPSTGKIHSSFNQTVTVTGRISSTEPNLQNIPIKLEMGRKIRKVFVRSDKNYVLLDADYSQIELRVLAHITDDANMIEAFQNNEDIHTQTATNIFAVPANEVTPLMRSRAKTVNFGIVYGMGDFSLAKDLGISRKEAKKYIDEYLNKYPNVRQYMHDIVQQGKNNGYVTTLFNRRRYLPELKATNFNIRSFGERIAMNTPIQGSAADIIKIAMVKVFQELKNNNLRSRLILQVHDELIIETQVEEIEKVKAILKDSMESAALLKVPLCVEVKLGTNWYEAK